MLFLHGERHANHSPAQQGKEGIGFAALPFQQKRCLCEDRLACQRRGAQQS